MYPRNAASPPRIAIGAVVQISDGAVQSAGVSVAVRAEGGAETAGGGTVSYGASSSIVYYAPTQAETNYTAFVVVAYKTGCIPVAQTIVTSASSTAGKVDVSHFGGTAVTGRDIGASVLLSPGTGTGQISLTSGAVTAGTVSDKTGYALSASQTFDLTGNVSGSVGSVTGAVTVGTNNDKTGYALSATGSAAMTEGYAALGAAPTLPQILYEIRALAAEKSISGTTVTAKKLDGTTAAATYTLDSATTPTSITRAT